MADNHSQGSSRTRLFTAHGTVIFVDTMSGELRHGSPASSPSNVVLVRDSNLARLKFVSADARRDIACLSDRSVVVAPQEARKHRAGTTGGSVFTYVPTASEEFGLTEGEKFLCAESDGRMTLSRSVCETWERFHLSTVGVGRLVEQMNWLPVHGATLRVNNDGLLIFGDGKTLDWHLLRWTDPRLGGARVKLTVVAKPAQGCDTNLYVHHWGGKDVCSIDKNGAVVLQDGAQEISVERWSDGYFAFTIVFENRHPTLSLGTGKPRGRYLGSGVDQYLLKSIEVELLPLNAIRQIILDRLWKGHDPFRDVPANLFAYDLQGWNSQHPYLGETIAALRPALIVEIGVWKGGSTIFMASEIKKHALSSVVIAIDTWLGSSEHWLGLSNASISFFNGHPDLYVKFLSNVIHAGMVDYVVPLPIDSLNAAQIMTSLSLSPKMIHLDGGHDYDSVMADLRVWWPILAPGGIFICDDYYVNGTWPGVRKACDDFFRALNLTPIENVAGKCRVRKSG